jgi:hypothetical protein
VWINKSSLVVEIEIDTGEKTNKHRQKNSSDLTLYNKNFPLHIRKKKKKNRDGCYICDVNGADKGPSISALLDR